METVQGKSGHPVHVIHDSTLSCEQLSEHFEENRATCAIIGKEASAIITEKDIVRLVADPNSRHPSEVTIGDIATPRPVCVDADSKPSDILTIMHNAHFRHVPLQNAVTKEIEDVTDIVTVANQLFNANSKNESMGAALSRLMTNIFSVFGSDDNTNAGDDEWTKTLFSNDKSARNDSDSYKIHRNMSVQDAAQKMIRQNTSALLVVDQSSGKLLGIFTESDIVRKVVSRGSNTVSTKVRSVMTKNPITFSSRAVKPVEALHMMLHRGFRHLPIEDPDTKKVCGLLNVLMLTFHALGSRLRDVEQSDAENIVSRGLSSYEARKSAIFHQMHTEVTSTESLKMTANVGDSSTTAPIKNDVAAKEEEEEKGTASAAEKKFMSSMILAHNHRGKGDGMIRGSQFNKAKQAFSRALLHVERASQRCPESDTDKYTSVVAKARADLYFKRAEILSILGEFSDALQDYKHVQSIAESQSNSTSSAFSSWLKELGIKPQLFFGSVLDTLFELDRFEEAEQNLKIFQGYSCSIEPLVAKFVAHSSRFVKCGNELLASKEKEDARTQFVSAKRIVKAMLDSSLSAVREASEIKFSLAQIASLIESTKAVDNARDKENNGNVTGKVVACGGEKKKIANMEDIKLLGQLMMNFSAPNDNAEENCTESVEV